MFAEEYTRYSLLNANRQVAENVDKKILVLIICLVLPLVLFCGSYMLLFGVYERASYPKSLTRNGKPDFSLYRAIRYSEYEKYQNVTDFQPRHYTAPKGQINFKLVCYYNFPYDKTSLQVKNIDPFLCTHINVAFASVVNSAIFLTEQQIEYLKDVVGLKETNKGLKVLLSVGGSGNDSGFPEMVLNHTQRKIFINSVLNYVKTYKIDGIDLDWEFPGDDKKIDRHGKMHFTQLLSELRTTLNRQPKYSFLITVAVAAPNGIVEESYDVSYMNEYVDFINLMSYDFHFYTKLTPFTGINSPLYATSNERYYLSTLNINYSSHYWNSLGMDKAKILVGLPTYGHTFRLTNVKNKGIYAPAQGYGRLGTSGFASFKEICNFLSTNHITPVFDMETYSPYAFKTREWVSFEDEQSLTYKTEFVKNNNFGGVMIYCLNTDDFEGVCKMGGKTLGKFPLVRKVKSVLYDTESES